jgi:ubiquitin carboxyl-terminal hydrolase 25/28
MNHDFVREVLSYQKPTDISKFTKRKQASIELVNQLKSLFSFMILSNKKYVDPSLVIRNIVDEQGEPIRIGD